MNDRCFLSKFFYDFIYFLSKISAFQLKKCNEHFWANSDVNFLVIGLILIFNVNFYLNGLFLTYMV